MFLGIAFQSIGKIQEGKKKPFKLVVRETTQKIRKSNKIKKNYRYKTLCTQGADLYQKKKVFVFYMKFNRVSCSSVAPLLVTLPPK